MRRRRAVAQRARRATLQPLDLFVRSSRVLELRRRHDARRASRDDDAAVIHRARLRDAMALAARRADARASVGARRTTRARRRRATRARAAPDDDRDAAVKMKIRAATRACALATLALAHADVAGAASFAVGGGDGFAGAPSFAEEDYAYQTPDLAVDLASPLVAYRLVTTALRQEVPLWLDAIIVSAALGALWVVVTGNHSLDSVLQ